MKSDMNEPVIELRNRHDSHPTSWSMAKRESVRTSLADEGAPAESWRDRRLHPAGISGFEDQKCEAHPAFTLDPYVLLYSVAIGELLVLTLVVFASGRAYHRFVFDEFPSAGFYFCAASVLSALYVVPCGLGRDYSTKRLLDPKEQFRSVLVHWHSAYSIFVFALFMSHATDFYSRGTILVQYAAGLVAAIFIRIVTTRLVARGIDTGRLHGKRVVVVGEGSLLHETLRRMRANGRGIELAGVVALGPRNANDSSAAEVGYALEEIGKIAQRKAIDDIAVILPWAQGKRIIELLDGLTAIPATIHLAPDVDTPWTRDLALARVGQIHTIRLAHAPLTLKDQVLKRGFDLVGAFGLLLLAMLPMALIAVLIKWDSPGPVLFRQRRNGFNGREFRVLKFRTMTSLDDGAVVRQVQRNDQRVTRIGQFLRRSNLDELPQLINVLFGDMSLVGPRPHAVAHNNEYNERISRYARRHNVKPGITGWAQVNGLRGETETDDKMRRRVVHDLYYIRHWSLLFDAKILAFTLFSPRSYSNAY
jgi:Undecaprenyl-phosphate glucose phosphotransferase